MVRQDLAEDHHLGPFRAEDPRLQDLLQVRRPVALVPALEELQRQLLENQAADDEE